jgi:hypothetical protein
MAQQFEWAQVIDDSMANEVGALDVDQSGNVYLAGVYGADFSLPYDANIYVTKTDPAGNELWSISLGDDLIMGEMGCIGEHLIIAVQVQGDIYMNGNLVFLTSLEFYMGLIVLDQNGNFVSAQSYPQYHGQNVHMDVDDGVLAMQCRGATNQGDNVLYFDQFGQQLSAHSLDIDASILDIAYYNGKTYLVGFAGFGDSVTLDDVTIPASTFEGQNFIIAFNEDFVAQWAHADTDVNGRDNRVVAGPSAIYSYQTVTTANFEFTSRIWKFNAEGDLLLSVHPPTFTNNVTLYPDMAISDCHVLLFASNAFNNDSHELIIFDHDLNMLDEKEINGNSFPYSGQVVAYQNQIYVAHVHTDNVDFNGETEIIDLLTDAIQYPYLAKVGVGTTCGDLEVGECAIVGFEMFDLHCDTDSTYAYSFNAEFINPTDDHFDLWVNNELIGFYLISDLPLSLSGITPRNSTHDIIKICVNDNPECCFILEYERPTCLTEGECGIVDFEMFDIHCDTDSTYAYSFNAEFINPTDDHFDLWVNNELIGFYLISDLPLSLSGITPRNSTHDIIKICVNDNPECCYVLEYLRPECLTTGLSEFEQSLQIFPNPLRDVLVITSSQDMSGYQMQIYDLTGREVYRDSGLNFSRINLSALEAGLYQMVVWDDEGNKMVKGVVKED